MKLAVVIPWCNRPELAATLARNARVFQDHDWAVTIVNCGGDADALTRLVCSMGVNASLVHVEGARFNRSLALNIGAAHCQALYVFMLDADLIVPVDTAEECSRALDERHVITIARICETEARPWLPAEADSYLADVVKVNTARFVFRDGRTVSAPTFRSYASDGSRGGQGQLIVAREHLMQVGGYNSQLSGWGYEDVDILVRLQHVLDLQHTQVGQALHLSHGDSVRDLRGTTRAESDYRNFRIASGNYANRRFLGSLPEDLAMYRDHIRITAAGTE